MSNTVSFEHGLGDRVKDCISGVTGIVVSRSQHLYGCVRYWVVPEAEKDGKPVDGAWYDEPQLVAVDVGVIESRNVTVAPPKRDHGFDLPSPRD